MKSDESVTTPENSDQQQNSETIASTAIKSTQPSENEADLEGTHQQKGGSTELNQQEANPAVFNQEKTDPTESRQQIPRTGKSRQKRLKFPESIQNYKRRSSEPKARKVKVSKSVRQIIIWTMTGFFDFNPRYFLQVRGLTNMMHIVSLVSFTFNLSIWVKKKKKNHLCASMCIHEGHLSRP